MKVGLVKKPMDVKRVHIERIRDAYPVYEIDYLRKLDLFFKLAGRFKNLYLAGRTGKFWYNNMDHSIEDAKELATRLLGEEVRLETI